MEEKYYCQDTIARCSVCFLYIGCKFEFSFKVISISLNLLVTGILVSSPLSISTAKCKTVFRWYPYRQF